ncbi:MAG: YgcG family protein, partial [Ignavibacteriae bacterium]
MKNFRWVVFVCMVAGCLAEAAAETKIPKLEQRVSDFTNTLSFQEWQQLDQLVKSYEDSTSTQVVVLMISSLDGENIEEYANKTFSENKIGQTKKDNGVLLVIAKQDHLMRIEVGYGLEGVLTDAVTSQIIRKEITPFFKADNYFGGLVTGVDAIIRAAAGEYHADNKGQKAPAISAGLLSMIIIF